MKSSRKSRRPKPKTAVDPRAILAEIASNSEMAPYVRVAAAKALLSPAAEPKAAEKDEQDAVTRRALEILKVGRR